jgi:hypothetical protein
VRDKRQPIDVRQRLVCLVSIRSSAQLLEDWPRDLCIGGRAGVAFVGDRERIDAFGRRVRCECTQTACPGIRLLGVRIGEIRCRLADRVASGTPARPCAACTRLGSGVEGKRKRKLTRRIRIRCHIQQAAPTRWLRLSKNETRKRSRFGVKHIGFQERQLPKAQRVRSA